MNKWLCTKVARHEDVAETIEENEKKGWKLHTYNCVQVSIGAEANHYLLFKLRNKASAVIKKRVGLRDHIKVDFFSFLC